MPPSSPSTGSHRPNVALVGADVEPVSLPGEQREISRYIATLVGDVSDSLTSREFNRQLFKSRDSVDELVRSLLHLRDVARGVMPRQSDLRIVR